MTSRRKPADAASELRGRVSLVEEIGRSVRLTRRGREHVGLCPFHNEKTPSFTVSEDKGFFHCFGCGAHGDVIGFVMRLHDFEFWDAVERLEGTDSIVTSSPPDDVTVTVTSDSKERNTEFARDLWHRAKQAAGTLAEVYLRARGITIEIPPTIRYVAGLRHTQSGLILPALVAAVQAPDRRVRGVLRIFLTTDGRRKAMVSKPKMMLGRVAGGAVRLSGAQPRLAIAEGLETALSFQQAAEVPTWATLSTSGMKALILPGSVVEVLIAADADRSGEVAASAAARRFIKEGRTVRIVRPPDGAKDFNDALNTNNNAAGIAA